MYTFQPLATIDTVNSHGALLVFAMICAVWVICLSLVMIADSSWDWVAFVKAGIILPAIPLIAATIISFTTGNITTFENTPVKGTFVKYETEGYNIAERSGKSTRRVDHHLIYVVYRVPEGDELMLAGAGMVYPAEAILYKN